MMDTKKDNNHLQIIGILLAYMTLVVTIVFAFKDNSRTQIIVVIIAVIIMLICFIIKYLLNKRSRINKLIEENLDNDAFQNYWKENIYIPIDITLDFDSNGERIPLFNHLMSMIKKNKGESRFICIMGDTGSGKTDALVHFLNKYVKEYSCRSSMPSQIRLYTMRIGYKKLLEKIKGDYPKDQDKKKCILLLDALDECNEARDSLVNTPEQNPYIFMKNLADETQEFALVVVTCRKQFFMREEFLPDDTHLEIGNPTGPDPFLHWQKLYIAPFINKQVKKYLAKKFNILNSRKKRKEAYRIVSSCKDVFLRPMILSHIDTVMNVYDKREEPLSMKDIYDAIVYEWILREAKNKQEEIDRLLNVSVSVAGYMYKNHLTYLDENHYKQFCEDYGIDDKGNLLRVNLLLSNTKEGYRFSHMSFYDYLLAYSFFLHPEDIDSVQGIDFTLDIYKEIYDAYKVEGNNSDIEQRLKIKEVPIDKVAMGLGSLANELHTLNRFKSAETMYQEALRILRQLAEKNEDAFLPYVATTLNNLANLHSDTNKHKEAEEEYGEALIYYRQLAEKNEDAFLPDVAMTLNNLANLHSDTNKHKEAEEEYGEALIYYRQLAEKNEDAFLPYVATTLNNLAALHSDTNKHKEAEEEYGEALRIRRQLAEKNEDAFLPYVATTLNNLAALHSDTNKHKEAEEEYGEALIYYRQLAEKNEDAFLPDVATTLNNLAALHSDTNKHKEAEEEYGEALRIRRQLAEKNEDAFLPDVAMTLNNLANLHSDTNKHKEAEEEYGEALIYYRQLAEKNEDAFLPDVARTLCNYSILHIYQNNLKKAEKEAQESLEIYKKMAEKSHEAFDIYVMKVSQLLNIIRKQSPSND